MQQPTSLQLNAYWDRVRNGRFAPRRFEVEPSKIAALLPETFIAEGAGLLGCRFRLAGTRICEQFGRELRGADLLSLWEDADRDAVASLLRTVLSDAAVGYGRFRGYTRTDRQAGFEFVLLPLIHTGDAINRILGAMPSSRPSGRQEIVDLNLHWPDGTPAFMAQGGAEVISLASRRFHILERGIGESD